MNIMNTFVEWVSLMERYAPIILERSQKVFFCIACLLFLAGQLAFLAGYITAEQLYRSLNIWLNPLGSGWESGWSLEDRHEWIALQEYFEGFSLRLTKTVKGSCVALSHFLTRHQVASKVEDTWEFLSRIYLVLRFGVRWVLANSITPYMEP